MLLPIRTSVRPWRTPYANYVLIGLNIVFFVFQYTIDPRQGGTIFRDWVGPLMLVPKEWRYWQFLSYAFLHQGIWHIVGNMYFLYLFGNNVNDKLGNVGYVCFYLMGAIFSGIGHTVFNSASMAPTLGASGAVAAVTGAYLVLFPQTLITVLYWLIFIGTIEVPALYFILLKLIVLDNMIARYAHVAYDAHLAGYAFGVTSVLAMLGLGLIQKSNFDLWSMLLRWNRQRKYRDVVATGYDPFSVTAKVSPGGGRGGVKLSPRQAEIQELRDSISTRIYEQNLSAGADLYLELMKIDSNQVLGQQNLLDIANHLAGDGRSIESAVAYEQFLKHYRVYEHVEQVELMLGLLYARYLNDPEKAREHLAAASDKLSDEGQSRMCRQELERLGQGGILG